MGRAVGSGIDNCGCCCTHAVGDGISDYASDSAAVMAKYELAACPCAVETDVVTDAFGAAKIGGVEK